MARHLSVATVIEKNKLSSATAFLILLDLNITNPNTRVVEEVVRIVTNTENVEFEGNIYYAANFDLNVVQKQGSAPDVTLTARDPSLMIQSRLEAYAGGVFSEVVLTVVNAARLDFPAEIRERFSVLGSSAKDFVITATLGAENPLQIQFPKYRQSRERCAWRFKGFGCGYAGAETTCTYVLEGAGGCKAKNNSLNFRGLPGLVPMNI
jgi:phage-related protein